MQSISPEKILVWYERLADSTQPSSPRRIVFTILDVSKLLPINRGIEAIRRPRNDRTRILFESHQPSIFEFGSDAESGTHSLEAPADFAQVGEVLVLADYGREVSNTNIRRAIFVFEFQKGLVTVLPQDWFNRGAYDFGYQWITRVWRDSVCARIVREGIRLGVFMLDESGRKVEKWLVQDAFYGPRG